MTDDARTWHNTTYVQRPGACSRVRATRLRAVAVASRFMTDGDTAASLPVDWAPAVAAMMGESGGEGRREARSCCFMLPFLVRRRPSALEAEFDFEQALNLQLHIAAHDCKLELQGK